MKWLLVGSMIVGQGADIATTCRALSTGRFVEANPLLPQSCLGIASVKAASTSGGIALALALRKHHPKWARVVAVSWAAAGATGAVINARRMR